MPMIKNSVVSEANVSVVGASVDEKEESALICESCSRIVLGKQIEKEGVCPLCKAPIKKMKEA
jgi:rubrerythrin